jgi:hypothetical protein
VKKAIGCLAILSVLTIALACAAAQTSQPRYSSAKPLYARLALDEKGSKVLDLVFDESGGTGTGYDTIYGDLNFNGDFSDDKPIKGTLRKQSGMDVSCAFPPIDVDAPYNEKAKGVARPCWISIQYYQLEPQYAPRPQAAKFFVRPEIRLREGAAEWTYTLSSISFDPAEKRAEAPAVRAFEDKPPALTVEAGADPKKSGYLGIQAFAVVGGRRASPSKGGKPIWADVRVTNALGKTVLHQNVALNKMFFG